MFSNFFYFLYNIVFLLETEKLHKSQLKFKEINKMYTNTH